MTWQQSYSEYILLHVNIMGIYIIFYGIRKASKRVIVMPFDALCKSVEKGFLFGFGKSTNGILLCNMLHFKHCTSGGSLHKHNVQYLAKQQTCFCRIYTVRVKSLELIR